MFDALRAFDHTAVSAIWAQCPDSGGIGLAVTNRLNKAAASTSWRPDQGKERGQ